MSETAQHTPGARQSDRPARGADRRGFLATVFGGLVAVGMAAVGLTGAVWAAVTARFMMPNTLREPSNRFKIGPASDYPPGTVSTAYKDRYGVWIVHGEYQGRQEIFALRTTCTHLGCITIWQPGQGRFKCPCHGSGFYPNGINYEGPAPRPLERYAIRTADDGQLEVDKSLTYQEELGQWNDPASFVPV